MISKDINSYLIVLQELYLVAMETASTTSSKGLFHGCLEMDGPHQMQWSDESWQLPLLWIYHIVWVPVFMHYKEQEKVFPSLFPIHIIIHLSVNHFSIHLFICLSFHPSIKHSLSYISPHNQSIYSLIYSSLFPSINSSFTHPSIYSLSIYPSMIHPSIKVTH